MKSALLGSLIAMTTVNVAISQGVLSFSNRDTARGVDAPFYQADGTTALDSRYVAQMWAGASREALQPISSIAPFRDGNGAGYWVAPLEERTEGVAVPGVAPGEDATVQLFVWEAVHGTLAAAMSVCSYGFSDVFVTATGTPGSAGPPPIPAAPAALVGLSSFPSLAGLPPPCPEPATLLLLTLGMLFLAAQVRRNNVTPPVEASATRSKP